MRNVDVFVSLPLWWSGSGIFEVFDARRMVPGFTEAGVVEHHVEVKASSKRVLSNKIL